MTKDVNKKPPFYYECNICKKKAFLLGRRFTGFDNITSKDVFHLDGKPMEMYRSVECESCGATASMDFPNVNRIFENDKR